jgi:spermidine synthase
MNDASDSKQGFSFTGYFAIAAVSASVIAYELFLMRVFSNGGWSHFGSTVISIAMFGFGVFSTVLCIWKNLFKNRPGFWINVSLLLLGPAMIVSNTLAQRLAFNPIFLVSDPKQKFLLMFYFLLYFIPFLIGAMFIGLTFLKGQCSFGRVYFANMFGSGLGGVALFCGMYAIMPEKLYVIPAALWLIGAAAWMSAPAGRKVAPLLLISVAVAAVVALMYPQINVSPYKGVSYAKRFPDSKRVYHRASPFGNMEVFSSSYFHFAPGLSDNASFELNEMPEKAYIGMYIDGDGPIGIMRRLTGPESRYIEFLPMSMAYLIKRDPDVFVMQFGGGISTNVALKMGAKRVTIAEGNPMIVSAVRDDKHIADFTGRILEDKKVKLIQAEGRIYVGRKTNAYDIIDLSLADSTGLSMPGGGAIRENYSYTGEAFASCIRALKNGGVLSVTVWNKEDPPKSTLKLMATMAGAAGEYDAKHLKDSFFISHTYLSTLTVLFKKGGFSAAETEKLKKYCARMSFELIYYPGKKTDTTGADKLFQSYRDVYFAPKKSEEESESGDGADMSAGNLYATVAAMLLNGDGKRVENEYIFNSAPLTNDRPYFAGFVKIKDIPKFLDKLESVSDEWGYLLLWATLLQSLALGIVLMLLPVVFGWRMFFAKHRGKLGVILYFLCLGLGYIVIEIALIGKFVLYLGNPTVSVTVLITGMLVFSGIGSLVSEKFVGRAKTAIIAVCLAIFAIIISYVLFMDHLFGFVSMLPFAARIIFCLAALFPLAFLMGFPFSLGMSSLAARDKEHFFVWAWGINGSFSVAGSVLVPIISVLSGLSAALLLAAACYLIALPAFYSLLIGDKCD